MTTQQWSDEEILQQVRGNANALAAAVLLYARDNGRSTEHFATFLAETFAPDWTGMMGAGALDIARAAAFNPVSLGATLVSIDGDAGQASAVLDASALEDDAAAFGVPAEDVVTLWRVFMERIAEGLGVRFGFGRDGSRWTFELTR
jgi:hypothetical protein